MATFEQLGDWLRELENRVSTNPDYNVVLLNGVATIAFLVGNDGGSFPPPMEVIELVEKEWQESRRHGPTCECAHCVTTVIDQGQEIPRS